jgi:hypothetical protein
LIRSQFKWQRADNKQDMEVFSAFVTAITHTEIYKDLV